MYNCYNCHNKHLSCNYQPRNMVQQNIYTCKMVEVMVSLSTSWRHWGAWEGRVRAPLILNLYIRRRWEIKTTLRKLYPRKRTPVPICMSFAPNVLSVFCEADRRNSLAALPEGVNRYSEVNLTDGNIPSILWTHRIQRIIHQDPTSVFYRFPALKIFRVTLGILQQC